MVLYLIIFWQIVDFFLISGILVKKVLKSGFLGFGKNEATIKILKFLISGTHANFYAKSKSQMSTLITSFSGVKNGVCMQKMKKIKEDMFFAIYIWRFIPFISLLIFCPENPDIRFSRSPLPKSLNSGIPSCTIW